MKPATEWTTDWRYGVEPKQEGKTSEELLLIFHEFWDWAGLDKKSKSTRQRYSVALHALGGYLVEETGNGHRANKPIQDFLKHYIDSGDGPLIHTDNEAWQNELDTVCRKFYKYLVAQC
jgi:hypothetical protein